MQPRAGQRWPRRATIAVGLLSLVLVAGCGGSGSSVPGHGPWFGPRAGADSLANTPIGGSQHGALAFSYRSTWTGAVESLRFYLITNPPGERGYSHGDLGTLRVSLVATRGPAHLPAAHVLAHVDYRPKPSVLFPLVHFKTPPHVTKGTYYAVVFTNVDPHAVKNWSSVNALLGHAAGVAAPPLPITASVLFGDAHGAAPPTHWRLRKEHPRDVYLPIIDIGGDSGHHAGLGYMESWKDNPKAIGGQDAVRELFTFDRKRADRVVSALVRVRRTSSGGVPLGVRLETPSGKLLAATQAHASAVPRDSAGWVAVRFAKPARLRPGEKVALVLDASLPDYEAFPLRDGSHYGFNGATVFGAGYAQFSSGGTSWVGWDMWGDSNRHDGDLQFALRLAD